MSIGARIARTEVAFELAPAETASDCVILIATRATRCSPDIRHFRRELHDERKTGMTNRGLTKIAALRAKGVVAQNPENHVTHGFDHLAPNQEVVPLGSSLAPS